MTSVFKDNNFSGRSRFSSLHTGSVGVWICRYLPAYLVPQSLVERPSQAVGHSNFRTSIASRSFPRVGANWGCLAPLWPLHYNIIILSCAAGWELAGLNL